MLAKINLENETFDPDPEGRNIHLAVKTHALRFAITKERVDEQRAKRCGCGSCKGEHEDSVDRLNFWSNLGRWTPPPEKSEIKIKHRKFRKKNKGWEEYDEGDDWGEADGQTA